jgi:hypothetical protein
MKHLVKFTARGNGIFPVDMLRYDRCFPADSESANNIAIVDLHLRQETRNVVLHKDVTSPKDLPTVARWNSFCWAILDVQVIKL